MPSPTVREVGLRSMSAAGLLLSIHGSYTLIFALNTRFSLSSHHWYDRLHADKRHHQRVTVRSKTRTTALAVADRVPPGVHVRLHGTARSSAARRRDGGGYIRCWGRAAFAVDVDISFYLLHLPPLRPVSIRPPSTLDGLLPRALTRSLEPTRHTLSAALLALSSSKTRSRPFRSFAPRSFRASGVVREEKGVPRSYTSPANLTRCGAEWSGVEWCEENASAATAGVETLLSRSHGRTFGNNDGPHLRRSAVDSNSVPAVQACLRFATYGWRAMLRLAARARASRRFRILHASGRRTGPSDVGFAGSEPEDDHGWSSSAWRRTYSFTKTHGGGTGRVVWGRLRFASTELNSVLTADVDIDAGIDLLRASLPRFTSHLTPRPADPHTSAWTILSLCPRISLLRPLPHAPTFHRDVDSEVHAHLALYPLRP
ncbi:hypothetical protein MSAN_00135000 [Mycena sanguinolenta]|uniref:Uncharacterized protein n=1 Tax=Mycena sanguinolenta TaxID=230812 RepID=A0A8H7DLW7_9AGAR|nr:hypothetical protein MSAN_00135000 [Mycena sanguinolenta]